MMSLIVYDDFDGNLVSSMSGYYTKPVGDIKYAEVYVPDGRYVVKMDVAATPHAPILNNAVVDPITVKITELENRLNDQDIRIAGAEDLCWIALEGAADTYEAVQPFLPN